jgi:hypothetical protein
MYTDPNGHAEIKANGREYTPKEYAEERELFKKLGRMIDLLEQGDKSVSAKDISKAGGTGFAESMSNIHLFELRYSISNRVDEIESYKTTISNYVNQLNKATNQADIDKYKAQIQAAYNAYQKQVTYLQSNWGIQVNGFEVVKNDAYYQAVATVYRYGNQNDSVFANNPALDFCNVMLALGEMGIGITGNKVLNNSKSSSGNQNNSSSASTNNQGKTAGLKEKAGNLVKGIVEKVKGVLGIGKGTSKTGRLIGSTGGLKSHEVTIIDDLVAKGNTVEVVPRSNVQGVKTYDVKVNGVATELKTLTNPNTGTGAKRIYEGFQQGADTVIIDGRQAGLTSQQAQEILSRASGKYTNKQIPGNVQIWTNDGIITYP